MQDDDFRAPPAAAAAIASRAQERPRERSHDQRQRRKPQQQQRPVADVPPSHGLIRESAAGTSATGTRRRSSSPAGSGE